MSYHLCLECWSFDFLNEIILENNGQSFSNHPNITETQSEVNVLIVFNQIDEGTEQGAECILGNISSHASAIGDWHWVRIDGSVSLLVDRVLADSW